MNTSKLHLFQKSHRLACCVESLRAYIQKNMISASSFASIVDRQRKMNENFIESAGSSIISSVTAACIQHDRSIDTQQIMECTLQSYAPRVFLFGSTVSCTALYDGDTDYAMIFTKNVEQKPQKVRDDDKNVTEKELLNEYMLLLTRQAQIEYLNKLYCLLVFAVGLREDASQRSISPTESASSSPGVPETSGADLQDDFQKCSLHFQRIFCARVPLIQFYPGYETKMEDVPTEAKGPGDSLVDTTDEDHAAEAAERTPEQFLRAPFSSLATKKIVIAPKPRVYLKSAPSVILDYKFDMTLSPYGVLNSILLRYYVLAFPCLRPLLLIIKHWGKRQGIINSRGGWLSSYALSIMLIEYLQTKGKVGFIDPFAQTLLDAVRRKVLRSEEHQSQCECHFCDIEKYIPYADAEVSEECGLLLKGFFQYYAFEVDFEDHVIDITQRKGLVEEAQPTSAAQVKQHPSIEGSCIDKIVSHPAVPLPMRHKTGVLEEFFTESEENSIRTQFERELAHSNQTFDANKALHGASRSANAQSGDYRWHYLGYNLFQIKDPYEKHSLGRSVEFFKAEALKELFELFYKQCSAAVDIVKSTLEAERMLSRGMFG